MIFASAGHHNTDPGAIANGYKESYLTQVFRNRIYEEIIIRGGNVILDKDYETLSQYLKRIQPGSGSVVCDLHFNASNDPEATGTEVFAANNPESIALATELSEAISKVLSIPNRGAKLQHQSNRSSLAILNTKAGISILPEICFMSNINDLTKFFTHQDLLAKIFACTLIYYDNLKS
jgi:N-acetylmuramoyl-L-alanine amidase